jgi:hypothetical protein
VLSETAEDVPARGCFDRTVTTTPLYSGDAQSLGFQIGAHWFFDEPPPELDELADGVLAWTDGPQLEALIANAAAAVWDGDFERELREALDEMAAEEGRCRHRAERALEELEALHALSQIVRAVVHQVAVQHAYESLPLFFCLCCIEESLADTDAYTARARVCEIARVADRELEIPHEEIVAAVRRVPLRPELVPGLLATDERREAMRARLTRIARLGSRSLPRVSAELRHAVAASIAAADPAADELWVALCKALVDDAVVPEMN